MYAILLFYTTAPPPPGALLRSIPEDQQLPLDQVRGQNYDLFIVVYCYIPVCKLCVQHHLTTHITHIYHVYYTPHILYPKHILYHILNILLYIHFIQELKVALGLLLKHRGGPGFGHGRLDGPELTHMSVRLRNIAVKLSEEAVA